MIPHLIPHPASQFCAVLRQAVQRLLDALDSPIGCQWEREEVETILQQDTGRLEVALLDTHERIASLAFMFADALHWQLYGTPRSPAGYVPSEMEVQEALKELAELTCASWALEAQRSAQQQNREG